MAIKKCIRETADTITQLKANPADDSVSLYGWLNYEFIINMTYCLPIEYIAQYN